MFTVRKLAIKNICYQKFRTSILLCLLLFCTIGIFGGSLLNHCMKDGLNTTIDRIGADIIVVPDKFVSDVEDALFQGKACTVNFDAAWQEKLGIVEGVAQTGTQLYIASLGAFDCCEGTVQMIAVDLDSDITIKPWLFQSGIKSLKKDEVVIGCNISKKRGEIIKYFGRDFVVKEVLEETGMGYDNCVFISYETAYEIASDSSYSKILPFSKNNQVISMVQINVEDGFEIEEVSERIQKQFAGEGIFVYTTSSLLSKFAVQIRQFEIFSTIAEWMLGIMAAVSLFAVITVTLTMRKNEIGSLLSVGVTKKKIAGMFIWEYSFLVMSAVILGIIIVCVIVLPFHTAIRQLLEVPYRMVSVDIILKLGIKALLVNFGITLLASLYSFYLIKKWHPSEMVKGAEC